MSEKGKWEGIPGKWIEDPTAIDGRRFIVSPRYVGQMCNRARSLANSRCEWCNGPAVWGERHHVFGRGMGSGKREDRELVYGVRFIVWLCRNCHHSAVIKPWGSWKLTVDNSVTK